MSKPLLSIVVPTKNRHEYLKSFVKTVAQLDPQMCEVVIQDNSGENNGFGVWLSEQSLFNIHYYHKSESVPISTNADCAILHSSGEYVCFMGDDDSVSSYISDLAAYMKANKVDSVRCTTSSYKWPGVVHKSHKFPSLMIPHYKGRLTELNPYSERIRCLKHGGNAISKLPTVYHAIVARAALDNIYERTGTFFPGPSPDMASGIALSYVVKKSVHIDAPFIMSGHSPKSAGGLGALHTHVGGLKSQPHLPKNIEDVWIPRIPMIWTAPTIYAQSVFQAIQTMGYEDELKRFSFPYLYAYFLHYALAHRKLLEEQDISFMERFAITKHTASIAWTRGLRFIANFLNTRFGITRAKTYNDLPTSHAASLIVDEDLRKNASLLPFAIGVS